MSGRAGFIRGLKNIYGERSYQEKSSRRITRRVVKHLASGECEMRVKSGPFGQFDKTYRPEAYAAAAAILSCDLAVNIEVHRYEETVPPSLYSRFLHPSQVLTKAMYERQRLYDMLFIQTVGRSATQLNPPDTIPGHVAQIYPSPPA